MSSEQTRSGVAFHCDVCGEVREPGGGARLGPGEAPRAFTKEWSDAWDEGWRASKFRDDWRHTCPDCM